MATGNGSDDPENFPSFSGNAGLSLGFNFPLDGSLSELCKSRAKVEIVRQQAEADKARLDFELVRLLKCGEAIKNGVSFHPESPYHKVCADVVVRYPQPINTSLSPTNPNGQTKEQKR